MGQVQTTTERLPKLEALTSIRFFAAFAVVVYHCENHLYTWPEWARVMLRHGGEGVTFFFVLSGFILAYNYLWPGRERLGTWKEFFSARFSRIYPSYITMMVLAFPLHLGYLHSYVGLALKGALLRAAMFLPVVIFCLHAYGPFREIRLWDGPVWTLSVEFTFYALFPFVAPRLLKASMKRPLLAWGAMLALCGLSYWGFRQLMAPQMAGLSGERYETLHDFTTYFAPIWMPVLFLGVCLFAVFHDLYQRGDDHPVIRVLRSPLTPWLAVVLFVYEVVAIPLYPVGPFRICLGASLMILCLAFGAWKGFLSQKWMIKLGEASFALYLVHQPIELINNRVQERLHIVPDGTFLWALPGIALSIVASFALHLWIEIPIQKKLTAYFKANFARPAQG